MVARTPLFQDSGGDSRQMQAGDLVPIQFGGVGQRIRGSVGVISGNSQIPTDNTAPLVTEGTQLWTATVTPQLANSNLIIDFVGMIDTSKINTIVTLSVYRGSTLIGFVCAASSGYNGLSPTPFAIRINEPSQGLTPVVYQCRIGIDTSNSTWYLGRPNGNTMGGVNPSCWSITEEL